jgi:hypothetical protein
MKILPNIDSFRKKLILFKQTKLGLLLITISRLSLAFKTERYYSQFGEDYKIQKYTPENFGFYVDIGSGDPVRGSNTFKLYKKGWRGTLIDPLSKNIYLSKLLRHKDKSIRGFIGKESSRILFYELEPYEYSTAIESRALELLASKKANLVRKVFINTIKFSDLKLNFDAGIPSLLNIDCEGFDFEVLSAINLNQNRFRVIIIEDTTSDLTLSNIHEYLICNAYQLVDREGISSIYVSKDYMKSEKSVVTK